MARKSAADTAAKWARNLGSAGESMKQGVLSVSQNPAEKAIAAKDRYLAGVQRAHAEGRYEKGLRKVSLQSWQQAMIDKGVARVSAGANAAKGKVEAFHAAWGPHMDALQSKLALQPRGSIQDNIQRMITAVEHAAQFRNK